MLAEFEVDRVFHLAALLSTRAEFTPVTAHHVNVEGTLNLLEFAQQQGESHGRPVDVHLPVVDRRLRPAGPRDEDAAPAASARTSTRIRRRCTGATSCTASSWAATTRGTTSSCRPTPSPRVDFRCVRFPGLISAITMPSGGTSDYAPEMIHAAAKGEPYDCFVRPDTTIPFMAMPDGVDALLALAAAPRERLTRTRLQPRRRSTRRPPRSARWCVAAFPSAAIAYKVDAEASGDRRLVAGRRGRLRGARRLGLRAALRFRSRVPRVPDPDDPQRYRYDPDHTAEPTAPCTSTTRRSLAKSSSSERDGS